MWKATEHERERVRESEAAVVLYLVEAQSFVSYEKLFLLRVSYKIASRLNIKAMKKECIATEK